VVKKRHEALSLTLEQFAERAGIHRTDLSDIGRACAMSDRMRPPVPKRVTAASSRLPLWGRFTHISGRRRFEDDRDGSVPVSHTGAGRVASPRLGVGRSGAMRRLTRRNVEFAAFEADTSGRRSPIQDAVTEPPGCHRPVEGPMVEAAPCERATAIES
jgi:hypothetical protein